MDGALFIASVASQAMDSSALKFGPDFEMRRTLPVVPRDVSADHAGNDRYLEFPGPVVGLTWGSASRAVSMTQGSPDS